MYRPLDGTCSVTSRHQRAMASLDFHPTNIHVPLMIPNHIIPHELWILMNRREGRQRVHRVQEPSSKGGCCWRRRMCVQPPVYHLTDTPNPAGQRSLLEVRIQCVCVCVSHYISPVRRHYTIRRFHPAPTGAAVAAGGGLFLGSCHVHSFPWWMLTVTTILPLSIAPVLFSVLCLNNAANRRAYRGIQS